MLFYWKYYENTSKNHCDGKLNGSVLGGNKNGTEKAIDKKSETVQGTSANSYDTNICFSGWL